MSKREVKESPFEQGVDETIAYKITVPTSWGTATLSSLSSKLYQDPDGVNTDVTATKMTGTTTASGQVITTPAISGLADGEVYRLETKFTSSEGDILECYAIIMCKR